MKFNLKNTDPCGARLGSVETAHGSFSNPLSSYVLIVIMIALLVLSGCSAERSEDVVHEEQEQLDEYEKNEEQLDEYGKNEEHYSYEEEYKDHVESEDHGKPKEYSSYEEEAEHEGYDNYEEYGDHEGYDGEIKYEDNSGRSRFIEAIHGPDNQRPIISRESKVFDYDINRIDESYADVIREKYGKDVEIIITPNGESQLGSIEVTGLLSPPVDLKGKNLGSRELKSIPQKFVRENTVLSLYDIKMEWPVVRRGGINFDYSPEYLASDSERKPYKDSEGTYIVDVVTYLYNIEFTEPTTIHVKQDGSITKFKSAVYPTDKEFYQTAKDFPNVYATQSSPVREKIKVDILKKTDHILGPEQELVLTEEPIRLTDSELKYLRENWDVLQLYFNWKSLKLYPTKPYIRYDLVFSKLFANKVLEKGEGVTYCMVADAVTSKIIEAEVCSDN